MRLGGDVQKDAFDENELHNTFTALEPERAMEEARGVIMAMTEELNTWYRDGDWKKVAEVAGRLSESARTLQSIEQIIERIRAQFGTAKTTAETAREPAHAEIVPHEVSAISQPGEDPVETLRLRFKSFEKKESRQYLVFTRLYEQGGHWVSSANLREFVYEKTGKEITAEALGSVVAELRRKLGDDLKNPRVLLSQKGKGYCLVKETGAPPVQGEEMDEESKKNFSR